MASRTLPNLGLKAFFALGEDGWNDEVDNNFLKLSVLTQGGAAGLVATKPSAPSQGDVYIMSAGASGNPNAIAVYDDNQWKHFAPQQGWSIYNRENDSWLTWVGTEWKVMSLANLRAVGELDSDGLAEKDGDNFVIRNIGVDAPSDIPTLAHTDARYSQIGHTHPVTGVTSFNTRSGSITLESGDVQAALGYVPQTTHPHLTSISALGNGAGLLEQIGVNAFAKRAIGVNAAGDVPTVGQADARYQGLHATLTGLSNVVGNENGVIEQFGPRTFRVRSIGITNNTDLLTRGGADTLYVSNSNFTMSQLNDVPDSYVGKAHHTLTVNSAENAFMFRAPGQVNIKNVTTDSAISLSDAGAHLRISHATGATLSIPLQSSVAFPVGTTVTVEQAALGTVTINPEAGVNLDFRTGYANYTDNQHSVVFLRKVSADRWIAYGDLVVAPAATNTADSVLIEADNILITADAI